MFCKNCGEEIDDNAVVCPKCGVAVKEVAAATAVGDAPNMGFAVLGFFFPIVGLILYLVWHTDYPLKAKSCGKGALIGFCVSLASSILMVVMVTCIAAAAAATMDVVVPMLML